MRKLKLTLDSLRVATFDPGPGSGHRGTVAAHNPPSQGHCGPTYGWAEPSCDYTCPSGCFDPTRLTALTLVCGGCNGS